MHAEVATHCSLQDSVDDSSALERMPKIPRTCSSNGWHKSSNSGVDKGTGKANGEQAVDEEELRNTNRNWLHRLSVIWSMELNVYRDLQRDVVKVMSHCKWLQVPITTGGRVAGRIGKNVVNPRCAIVVISERYVGDSAALESGLGVVPVRVVCLDYEFVGGGVGDCM